VTVELREMQDGSMICDTDPGEPIIGLPRISITEPEGRLLGFLASNKTVLEIGTGLGISTDWLAAHAYKTTTVDIDPWVHENVWPDLHKKVKCVKDSVRVADQTFNMVFIDGYHSAEQATADIAFARSVMDKGIIVCHDARDPEVRSALDDDPADWLFLWTAHGIAITYHGWTE
jgi:predicted O-methyltransferase YrrM